MRRLLQNHREPQTLIAGPVALWGDTGKRDRGVTEGPFKAETQTGQSIQAWGICCM